MLGEAPEPRKAPPPSEPATVVQPPPSGTNAGALHASGQVHAHHSPIQFRFLDELKHRNVIRIGILYLVVCWLILDPVHVLFHMLEVPVWANRLVVILMAIGFPGVLLFAWVYEITPEGLRPTAEVEPHRSIRTQTGQRLNRAIIMVMAVALAYFVVDKFWISKRTASSVSSTVSARSQSPAVPEKSIAVLPFVDLSEKHDQEYFADGMAEEVLDLLAKLPGLTVIGRSSSFQFKGKSQDLRAIGSALRVRYVVEGSVRRSRERLRVTAQLISAQDGSHLWSDTYDEPVGDALKVQDQIASNLVRALQVTVGADFEQGRASFKTTEAYDLYLRGRHAYNRFDKEGLESAATYFQQVSELDPTSVSALEWLALAQEVSAELDYIEPGKGFERARLSAQRVLGLNPKSSMAHATLSWVHLTYDWDWAAAEREAQEAIRLKPRDSLAMGTLGAVYKVLGRWDEAERLSKTALTLEPLYPDWYSVLIGVQIATGRLSEAEAGARKVLEISPTFSGGRSVLGQVLLLQGNFQGALAEIQQEPSDAGRYTGLAMVYHALGRRAESDAALAQVVREHAQDYALQIAEVYAYRGEADLAFAWLDRAYNQKDTGLRLIKSDHFFKTLRDDPRYRAFLRKMNLPE